MLLRGWLCLLALGAAAQAEVTWNKEVSRIFQAKCQICHKPDDVAPFSLLTYDDASAFAPDIRRVLEARTMPPWKPVHGAGSFRDSFALTDEERQTVLGWIAAGTPQGDPADAPEPLPDTGPWQAGGDPDLVLSMPEYKPPRAKDLYRCFVLDPKSDDALFVKAAQPLPGDKRSVHHVLLYIDTTGESSKLDGKDGAPGYTCFGGPNVPLGIGGGMGGWVPGMRTRPLPEGVAVFLPPKAKIVMQIHYYNTGVIQTDRTQLGLWFAKPDTVRKRLVYIPVVNDTFTIPPGESNYEVRATLPIPPLFSAQALTIAPHMHLLGKKIRMQVRDRDGSIRPMIYIDDWDFNWQGVYTFTEPVTLPVGSTVELIAHYDNTVDNPRNPSNPLKPVRWGEGTEDEMALGFLGVVFDNDILIRLGRVSGR